MTLHVGLGTFKPVTAELVAEHRMHAERYEIPEATAAAIARARAAGGRVVAVGTTVVRTLESAAPADGGDGAAGRGAHLALHHPGLPLPRGRRAAHQLPPAALDAADAGQRLRRPRATCSRLYREAVAAGYRFYSYGDAMLVERAEAKT